MGFFKEKSFFSYSRCSSCGLLYAPVFFTPHQLEKLYAQMSPNMDIVPEHTLRKTQYGYFKALKRHSDLKGVYLEVGPDTGLLTEPCSKAGQFSHYWLFEPNRDVTPVLRNVLSGKSFEIVHDMFGFSIVPDSSLDVVTMVHVLDHLLDPVSTLRELRQKMRRGSKLLIVTHNESSLLRKLIGWRWPAFCLQHPELYNMDSIAKILDKAGFEIVEQSRTVNYFPLSFLLKHLLWAYGVRVKSVPNFGGMTVGLPLGNMINIATPKEPTND